MADVCFRRYVAPKRAAAATFATAPLAMIVCYVPTQKKAHLLLVIIGDDPFAKPCLACCYFTIQFHEAIISTGKSKIWVFLAAALLPSSAPKRLWPNFVK